MLTTIDEGVWVAEHHFRMGLVDFGGRMTVLRLEDGALLLYSPIAIDDALASAIDALGEVRHVVAPSAMHHVFLDAAAARYPAATVYAPRALHAKRRGRGIDVVLEDAAPEAWGDGLAMIRVAGAPSVDEVILHHAASRTLVVCDLVFHIHEARGWISPLFFKLIGVWQRVQQGPLWRWQATKDRAAAEASLAPIWAWDVERVIVAHGRILEGPDAKARLAEGLRWMCPGQAHPALPSSTEAPSARAAAPRSARSPAPRA